MYNLSSITRGPEIKPPRIIIAGEHKVGKSTFAAGFPAPIFIPIKQERGVNGLDVAKFPPVEKWADMTAALGALATEKHEFRTVVIDSVTTLEPVILADVCEEFRVKTIEAVGGGWGKGFTEALYRWRELVKMLDWIVDEAGMGVILVSHVAAKTFADPVSGPYDRYQLSLHEKAAGVLLQWADVIGFAATNSIIATDKDKRVRATTGGEMNVLKTGKSLAYPSGKRTEWAHLPDEIDLTYEAFSTAKR